MPEHLKAYQRGYDRGYQQGINDAQDAMKTAVSRINDKLDDDGALAFSTANARSNKSLDNQA